MASYIGEMRGRIEAATGAQLDDLLRSLATTDHTVQASMAAVPDEHFDRYLEIVHASLSADLGIGPMFGPPPVTTLIHLLPMKGKRRAVFVKTFDQLMGLGGSQTTRKKWLPIAAKNSLCVEVARAWIAASAPEVVLDETGDAFGIIQLLLLDDKPRSIAALEAFARRSLVAGGKALEWLRLLVERHGSPAQSARLGLIRVTRAPVARRR